MRDSVKLGILNILLFISFIFAARIFNTVFAQNNQRLFSPSARWSFNFMNPESEGLKKIISAKLSGQKGDYAILVKDLGSNKGEYYAYQEDKVMPSGSLYKLFLLAAAYEEIEKGNLKEDDVISTTKAHLDEVLGAEEFGYEDAPSNISYTVTELLTRISTISDNYASIMLAEKIGWAKVQAQADKIGAVDTRIKDPISTTASDIALFYEKLYKGQVVSPSASSKIIDLLAKSRLNSRIPNQLPPGLKIAHKTGELASVRHDAGIVYLADGRAYLIVMMASNVQYEDDAEELEAEISKEVYNYFSSKK